MPRVESSIVINRPPEEVFAFLSDKDNDPLWQSGVVEASKTSEGPWAVGSTGRNVNRFLGRQIESTWEITEYELNKKVSFKSTSGPMPYQGSWTLEPVENGTRYTVVFYAEIGGLFKLAEPLVLGMAKRQMETDLGNVKDLLEAQA